MDQASTNSRIVAHTTHTNLTALSTILPPTPWVSLAEGLLFGLPAGFLMAVLVALRVSGSLGDVLMVFLGAWGLHGLLVGTAAGILRICRPLPSRSPTFVWAVLLAVLPLARLGMLLAERTHHRPLGATTFALVALVVILGFWACAARAFGMRRSAHRHNRLFGMSSSASWWSHRRWWVRLQFWPGSARSSRAPCLRAPSSTGCSVHR
jgi:hypothetical protein